MGNNAADVCAICYNEIGGCFAVSVGCCWKRVHLRCLYGYQLTSKSTGNFGQPFLCWVCQQQVKVAQMMRHGVWRRELGLEPKATCARTRRAQINKFSDQLCEVDEAGEDK